MKFKLKLVFSIAFILLCTIGISSCQNEEETLLYNDGFNNTAENGKINNNKIVLEKDSALSKFAQILSLALYNRTDIRQFLKEEASKKFDGNSDILYNEVKDCKINGTTFREILVSFSSKEQIEVIENSLLGLNMFIPEIPAFDIHVDNMDCNDNEIPVGFSNASGMTLYLNGIAEVTIPKGELPNFHSVVVNENELVEIKKDFKGKYAGFVLSEATLYKQLTRSTTSTYNEIGYKAATAYDYFNKDDGSKYSRSLQRDYIYYGITPNNGNGSLNQGVNEYISFIEVNPKSYFLISDEDEKDPHIKKYSVSRKGKDFTTAELISKMWETGTYTFRFEIITSDKSRPSIRKVSASPQDLWDFHIDRSFRHATLFRQKKYSVLFSLL